MQAGCFNSKPFRVAKHAEQGHAAGGAPAPDAERPICIPTQSVGTRNEKLANWY